ncbi:MAG: acetolactate synthase large subunit, partial [Gammaproteobacteria bacterium]|nr:acetolactate synthase large subunit [Gammaproteobacteria bacterium]
MKAAELLVKCLEAEGVTHIFGVPGEENLDVMDALLDSSIQFVTTRHEQGAAFMADMHGRLSGKAGVCLSTLGPGATNLITGVADANMDRAPLVAIAGQAATTRLHKESHQVLDLTNLFRPVTKYTNQIFEPENIPEIVRKAFKVAQTEKPGACFIDFPENIAAMPVENKLPLKVQHATPPYPPEIKVKQAADLINAAKRPLIMTGNGVVRANAHIALQQFAEKLQIPVVNTFMAKGVIPFSHPLALGTIGLASHDYVSFAMDKADLVICVGFDMVEYHPYLWNGNNQKKIIHIDASPAEVDEHYQLEAGVIGDITISLPDIAAISSTKTDDHMTDLRKVIVEQANKYAHDTSFPLKPQKILYDLRQVLKADDIVISDVGAHKMWVARLYQAEKPNTCIISNGFASMGISLPGAIAAKLLYPERTIVSLTGDGGFLMNSQELETALRVGTPMIVLVWTDSKYGLIEWKQEAHFNRTSNIDFNNPDFVQYAESFGAKGYRITSAEELIPTLKRAIADNTVCIIDCPVDYSENMKLTRELDALN